MPLYEYLCEACGERFEIIQKFSDPPPDACEKCGKGPVHRQQSSPAIQFKGSGWYITDYAQKGKTGGDAATSAKSSSTTESSSTDSPKSTDSKSTDSPSSAPPPKASTSATKD
jgi:putative FmdB family regulatory protein